MLWFHQLPLYPHFRVVYPEAVSAQPTNRLTETIRDQPVDHDPGEASRETRRLGQWHTVREAAEILGTTVDAVRGRIRRGTLDSMKVAGQAYVLLDATNRDQHADKSATVSGDEAQLGASQSQLVDSLRERMSSHEDQIEWLRREVERKDMIIMQMSQRMPELEVPSEPRDAPEPAAIGLAKYDVVPPKTQEPAEHGSWLHRFFFGT